MQELHDAEIWDCESPEAKREEVQQMMNTADKDGDARLSFQEFSYNVLKDHV